MDAKVGPERLRAWSFGVAVMVIWGASFVATRIAVAEIPPLTLAFLRFALALLLLAPWVRRAARGGALSTSDRRAFVVVGLLGVTVAFVLENYGLAHTTASHGAILIALTPLATVMAESAWRRRLPPPLALVGFVVALAGVVWLVGPDTAGEASLLGDVLMLASVVVWVAYGFLVERLTRRHPAGRVTNAAIFWGVVTLAPLALGELVLSGGMTAPSPKAIASTVILGVFCSALGYLWWNEALRVLGATATNSLIYGIPLVAVAGGVWLLDEPLTPGLLGGGALVILGLLLANRRPPPEPGPREAD